MLTHIDLKIKFLALEKPKWRQFFTLKHQNVEKKRSLVITLWLLNDVQAGRDIVWTWMMFYHTWETGTGTSTSSCGWSACLRAFRADSMPSVKFSWTCRRIIGAKSPNWSQPTWAWPTGRRSAFPKWYNQYDTVPIEEKPAHHNLSDRTGKRVQQMWVLWCQLHGRSYWRPSSHFQRYTIHPLSVRLGIWHPLR